MNSILSTHSHDDHERFRELCCLSLQGQISREEQSNLDQHLAGCSECREVLAEFEDLTVIDFPEIMSKRTRLKFNEYASQTNENDLLAGILRTGVQPKPQLSTERGEVISHARISQVRRRSVAKFWVSAAAALAAISIVIGTSRKFNHSDGPHVVRQTATVRVAQPAPAEESTGPDKRVDQDRRILQLEKMLEAVRARLAVDASESHQLQATNQALLGRALSEEGQLAQKDEQLSEQRVRLDAAQESARTFEARILGLQAQLEDANAGIAAQQERDRVASLRRVADHALSTTAISDLTNSEMRELFGARDLHIVDVYDTDRNGKRSRTFGRIYYVDNRLLLFYAFDLSAREKRRPVAFQAWGYQQPNSSSPQSLGLFYVDDPKVDRWELRVNDPKLLSRIDAVFVTVEPPSGSASPRGHELLFASLSGPANHP